MESKNLKSSSNGQIFSEIITKRRATPHFDGTPIDDADLKTIIKAGMEAPSGYNMQPWRFVVVRDLAKKHILREAAMGQPKIEEAGAIIVFCGDLNATQGPDLDAVLEESTKHGFEEKQNQQIKKMIGQTFSSSPGNAMGVAPDYAVWLNRHVMIAFTTMMWMAEFLGYDTAPMEGFFEDKLKSILDIPDDVRVVAILGIGRLKGPDKPYAGRRKMSDICFAESWGKGLD